MLHGGSRPSNHWAVVEAEGQARCGIGLLTKSKSPKNLKTLQNGVFGLGVQWDLAGSRRNCVLAAAALPG